MIYVPRIMDTKPKMPSSPSALSCANCQS